MQTKRPRILCVGSLVMDLITRTTNFPQAGETSCGATFSTAPGGKGANQAVQAARLGADVSMVGAVGKDAFGRILLESLQASGVDTSGVVETEEAASAVGTILLEERNGVTQNRILVAPGANQTLRAEHVAFLKDSIGDYDMVMLQFEIPMEINLLVSQWAADAGVPVMLNAAPYFPAPDALLKNISYISPNEYEASQLSGISLERGEHGIDTSKLLQAAQAIFERGVKNVIITLGDQGSVLYQDGTLHFCPCGPSVGVSDPTAAGDSFVSAFCTARSVGLGADEAMRFAACVATITVSRTGAQPSLPTLDEVLALMQESGFAQFDLSLLDCLKR